MVSGAVHQERWFTTGIDHDTLLDTGGLYRDMVPKSSFLCTLQPLDVVVEPIDAQSVSRHSRKLQFFQVPTDWIESTCTSSLQPIPAFFQSLAGLPSIESPTGPAEPPTVSPSYHPITQTTALGCHPRRVQSYFSRETSRLLFLEASPKHRLGLSRLKT